MDKCVLFETAIVVYCSRLPPMERSF